MDFLVIGVLIPGVISLFAIQDLLILFRICVDATIATPDMSSVCLNKISIEFDAV